MSAALRPSVPPRFHSLVLAAGTGVFGAGLAFDVTSWRAADQFIYAQGGFVLGCIGLLIGVVGVIVTVGEFPRGSGTSARRTARLHLVLTDAVLGWFAVGYLLRADRPLVPIGELHLAANGLAVAVAVVAALVDLHPSRGAVATDTGRGQ